MAEEAQDDKTESPTAKRRGDARQKGTVVKSTEVNSVIVLLTGLFMLKFFGRWMLDQMGACMVEIFKNLSSFEMTQERLIELTAQAVMLSFLIITPVCVGIMLFGVVANVMQIGFLFTAQPITPNLNKVDPISGFKRLFSARSLVEAVKNIIKLVIIGFIAYWTVMAVFEQIMMLADASVITILNFAAKTSYDIILRVSLALIVLAILDWSYQKYEHEKQLKMTKQEVKEEHKQMDGDPQVKARIKSVQRERRMMQEVPKATVVVTNPTFIAIALRYEPAENDAPMVLAKGKRIIAEKIKQLAIENGIPIIEDRPLARGMYDKIEVGFPIPADFFTAVAEIMAYVYRLKHRKAA
jgi:flagellar biosynthetic protein FlhB